MAKNLTNLPLEGFDLKKLLHTSQYNIIQTMNSCNQESLLHKFIINEGKFQYKHDIHKSPLQGILSTKIVPKYTQW